MAHAGSGRTSDSGGSVALLGGVRGLRSCGLTDGELNE